MNGKDRRKLEMGKRAWNLSVAHPDPNPGSAAAVAQLGDAIERGDATAAREREGHRTRRAGTVRKRQLRAEMRGTQLPHVIRVAALAAREVPELAQKITMRPGATTYLAFRTDAHGVVAEAQANRALLVRHGLADTMLDGLVQSLEQFDAALDLALGGHQAHVGASAELSAIADEIVQIVGGMDGFNRYRFRNDHELLAAWESASNVVAAARATKPEEDGKPGEVTPAEQSRPAA